MLSRRLSFVVAVLLLVTLTPTYGKLTEQDFINVAEFSPERKLYSEEFFYFKVIKNNTNCTSNCSNYTIYIPKYGVNNTNTKNCTNCTNCTNVVNCINCTNLTDVTNGQNLFEVRNSKNIWEGKYITNVTDCTNCRNVYNSRNILNGMQVRDSVDVHNGTYCKECRNCTNCHQCTKCRRCLDCASCDRCIGYRCKNSADCRNSIYKFIWWEPKASDKEAWTCGNPAVYSIMFEKLGYKSPTWLKDSKVNTNLAFCKHLEGNRTCCTREATVILAKIFKHYRETLQIRSSIRIREIRTVFEKYHGINFTAIPLAQRQAVKRGVTIKMRDAKIVAYKLAQAMSSCGRYMLTYAGAMLCLGCLPKWKWTRYVPLDTEYPDDEAFFNFNPDAQLKAVIDISKRKRNEIHIGKVVCEHLYGICRSVIKGFLTLPNNTAVAIGGFAEGITEAQPDYMMENFESSQQLLERRNKQIALEISQFSKRTVQVYGMTSAQWKVDKTYIPIQNALTKNDIILLNYKSAMMQIGGDYPADPLIYYNFNPSINYENDLDYLDSMCRDVTGAINCTLCDGGEYPLKIESNKTNEDSEAKQICNEVYENRDNRWLFDMTKITNKQYREFSPFFFQAKIGRIKILKSFNAPPYIPGFQGSAPGSNLYEDTLIRNITLPPWREGELRINFDKNNATWDQRKEYYTNMEIEIKRQWDVFEYFVKKGPVDRVWNDEKWMNYIYPDILGNGRKIFYALNQAAQYTTDFIFTCDYNNICTLCPLGQDTTSNKCVKDDFSYNSECQDCHYNKVKLVSECVGNGCSTCLYIGGDENDKDKYGFKNEPLDKCFIREDRPFFDENKTNPLYYSPYREIARDDFKKMIDMFDLRSEKAVIWNIAQISRWFYRIKNANYYSALNAKRVYNGTFGIRGMSYDKEPEIKNNFLMPDMSELTEFNITIPCRIESPNNACKKYICGDAIENKFLVSWKVAYNPEIQNITGVDDQYPADQGVFSLAKREQWIAKLNEPGQLSDADKKMLEWKIGYGTGDTGKNDTYYDVNIYGPGANGPGGNSMIVLGVDWNTDLKKFTEKEETFKYGRSLSASFTLLMMIYLIFTA